MNEGNLTSMAVSKIKWITILTAVFLPVVEVPASMTDAHLTVSRHSDYSYSEYCPPSVNDDGDIVVCGKGPSGRIEWRVFMYDGESKRYNSFLVTLPDGIRSENPVISNRDLLFLRLPEIRAGNRNTAGAAGGDGLKNIGANGIINSRGTVAFIGKASGANRIYLKFKDQPPRPATVIGTQPESISEDDGIAVNMFNQVAYIGTNSAGKKAIFSTNLGANREIVAVGDRIEGREIESLHLYDGLMDSGQLVYLAKTTDGEYRIVRTNRAYTQAMLNDSPVPVFWEYYPYLLRGTPEFSAMLTMRDVGCNLVSTANALSYFGSDVTPGELQDWLLRKHAAARDEEKRKYIDENNDFQDEIVEYFTRERFNAGLTDTIVVHREFTSTGPGSNWKRLVSELRSHRPARLRVPSHTGADYRPFGHFVLAYGLLDPTKPDSELGKEDILIHDPGFGGNYTLEMYEKSRSYHITHPDWLDDSVVRKGKPVDRLYLYECRRGTGPIPPGIDLSLF